MVFSSHVFLFYFLPAALAAYYATRLTGWRRASTAVLALFNFGFYAWAYPP